MHITFMFISDFTFNYWYKKKLLYLGLYIFKPSIKMNMGAEIIVINMYIAVTFDRRK